MPKFMVERLIPEAGNLSAQELGAIAEQACRALKEIGPGVQWVQSAVTEHRLYCIYIAPNQAAIYEHARRAGFPVDRVSIVNTTIDPTTAETIKKRD